MQRAGFWTLQNFLRPLRFSLALAMAPFFNSVITFLETQLQAAPAAGLWAVHLPARSDHHHSDLWCPVAGLWALCLCVQLTCASAVAGFLGCGAGADPSHTPKNAAQCSLQHSPAPHVLLKLCGKRCAVPLGCSRALWYLARAGVLHQHGPVVLWRPADVQQDAARLGATGKDQVALRLEQLPLGLPATGRRSCPHAASVPPVWTERRVLLHIRVLPWPACHSSWLVPCPDGALAVRLLAADEWPCRGALLHVCALQHLLGCPGAAGRCRPASCRESHCWLVARRSS